MSSIGKSAGRSAATLSAQKSVGSAEFDESGAAIPADLIDLRPEDLRVEAEFFHGRARTSEQPREPEPAPSFAQVAPTTDPIPPPNIPAAPSLAPPEFEPPAPVVSPAYVDPRAQMFATAPPLAAAAPVLPPMSPDIPAIEIEPTSIRGPEREFQPLREVVLPASAVLAWSLFGLIGIATSFIAGLMLGHYFWKG